MKTVRRVRVSQFVSPKKGETKQLRKWTRGGSPIFHPAFALQEKYCLTPQHAIALSAMTDADRHYTKRKCVTLRGDKR